MPQVIFFFLITQNTLTIQTVNSKLDQQTL